MNATEPMVINWRKDESELNEPLATAMTHLCLGTDDGKPTGNYLRGPTNEIFLCFGSS